MPAVDINLHLDLSNVVKVVDDALKNVLGAAGQVASDVAPFGLVIDLAKSIDSSLAGAPTGLLKQVIDAGLLDISTLVDTVGSVRPGDLDLGGLQGVLSGVAPDALKGLLDDVFDKPLLGLLPNVVDNGAVAALGLDQFSAVSRYVTSIVGAILDQTGDPADARQLMNMLLNGDNTINGDDQANTIDGLAGHDTINGQGGADTLNGGDGNDSVDGGAGADSIDGGTGADILRGGDGADFVRGGEGADSLYGGAQNDTLEGGLGDDYMEGGSGDDTYSVRDVGDVVVEAADGGRDLVRSAIDFTLGDNLEDLFLTGNGSTRGFGNDLDNRIDGNAGRNFIDGAAGADNIYGGGGVDKLIGGDGADLFRYTAVSDSGLGAGNRDIIFDFQEGLDRISIVSFDGDLARDGNQAFKFDGTGALKANGLGQVNYEQVGGRTIVNFDVDGNGAADFQIDLVGTHALTAADFIL